MKTILSELLPAIMGTLVLAGVTCGAYPLLVTGVARVAFAKAEAFYPRLPIQLKERKKHKCW